MTFLLENPLPILAIGGLCAIVAGTVFLSRRTGRSLLALVGIIVATVALVFVERYVQTDREQIETGVYGVMDAIEANDLPGVLQWIDPSAGAQVKADAEALMPLVRMEAANAASTLIVELNGAEPNKASVQFKGFINGTLKSGGARLGYFDKVELRWAKVGDQWRIVGYTAYWEGRPLDAVDSVRSNRAISR